MITTVTSVQRFATKTLYTRARATDGSTMLAPMSPGAGKGLTLFLTQSSSRGLALSMPTLAFARAVGREPVDLVGCSAHCTSV